MFGATSLFAKEIKKTLSKEFKTNSSTVISMETKFSELTVETWNKNVASFDVTIVVEHNDEEKAQKMLDLFTVEFDQDGNEITVETKVKEGIITSSPGSRSARMAAISSAAVQE